MKPLVNADEAAAVTSPRGARSGPPLTCLRSRDMLFGAFMIATYALYLYQAVPELCSVGPPGSHSRPTSTPDQSCVGDIKYWPVSWQLVCGHLTDRSRSIDAGILLFPALFSPLARATEQCSSEKHSGSLSIMGSLSCWWLQRSQTVASKAAWVVLLCLQGFVTFLGLGWLHEDLTQIVITPIRIIAWVLLFLPLPRIDLTRVTAHTQSAATSRHRTDRDLSSCNRALVTWQSAIFSDQQLPVLRHLTVAIFRLLPPITAACSVGHVGSSYFAHSCLSFYPTMGLYVYVGWTAWLLLLPFKLHLVVSAVEWLLSYTTAVRVVRSYKHVLLEQRWTGWNSVTHVLASLLFVLVLPGLGAWWMEQKGRRHKEAAETAAAAAAATSKALHNGQCCSKCAQQEVISSGKEQDPADGSAATCSTGQNDKQTAKSNGVLHSISCNHTSTPGDVLQPGSCEPIADPHGRPPSIASSAISSGSQLMSHITASLQLAAAAPKVTLYQAPAALPATPAANHTQTSSRPSALPDILPSLRGLVGAEAAAAVFTAAAAAAAASRVDLVSGVDVPVYRSMAANLPVGVKVHSAPHSAVSALSPLLTSALQQQVTAVAGVNLPAYSYNACFRGCVQLLASVYSLRGAVAGGASTGEYKNDDGDADSPHTTVVAADLLNSVHSQLGSSGEGSSVLPGVDASHIDVSVGTATASTHICPDSQECSAATSVAAGVTATKPTYASSTSTMQPDTSSTLLTTDGPVKVLNTEPACVTSGQQQQMVLYLSGTLGCERNRLLMFQQGSVVVDQEVALDGASPNKSVIRVDVPSLASGVVHVALLPGPGPTDQAAGKRGLGPAASSQALLLQPLLVLPEAAAAELQVLCEKLASATDTQPPSSKEDRAAAAWSAVADLAVDVAYVLAAACDTEGKVAATSAGSGVLPPGVSGVLAHVCVYLATWGCISALKFLIDHLAQRLLPSGHEGVPEPPVSDIRPIGMSSEITAGCELQLLGSSTASLGTAGSSSASGITAAANATEYEPDTKPPRDTLDTNSTAKTAYKQPASEPATAGMTAGCRLSAEMAPTWDVKIRHLSRGFRDPALETQYIDDLARQTFLADLFSAVYGFAIAVSADVLTDRLRSEWSAGAWGLVAWEVLSRFVNFAGLVIPNCLLLLYRHRLARGGRREWAIVWCERCLAAVPLATGLGLLRINASAVELLASPAVLLTVMLWVSGAVKAAARQVRARKLLPTLLVEFAGAVALSLPLGLSLGASLFRYAGVPAVALVTAVLLELRSRTAFLDKALLNSVPLKAE